MKELKNIDRLFQEKFKDFEAQPGDHVWEAIAAREKQKRRRVIPLWLKLSGAAAVLALLLLAGNFVFNNQDATTPKLVEEEIPERNDHIQKQSPATPEAVANENATETGLEKSSAVESGDNSRLTQTDSKPDKALPTKTGSGLKQKNESVALSQSEKTPQANQSKDSEAAIAQAETRKNDIPQDAENNNGNAVAAQETENAVSEENQAKIEDPDELLRLANEKEAIADTDEKENPDEKSNRWGIAPVVAPVYYGDFGGSGIDPQFADNTKRGDVNFSYGLQISYALTKKLSLRAGVNRVDLGYRTEEVAFSPSIQASALRSIDYKKNASQVQVSSFRNNMVSAPDTEANEFAASSFISTPSTLRQQLGYIEVPLEAEYSLIDKRFGFQLIGGFSTLFLNNNSIILEEGSSFSSELGSSNSLNNTSFSTNIGLGFDYRITPSIEFNLEPMFKYQLNAYTNGVSDFKPYYMGLYTGINLKF